MNLIPEIHDVRAQSALKMAAIALLTGLALAGCNKQQTELGQGLRDLGSAGPLGANHAAKSLEQCAAPIATVALVENPRGYVMPYGNGQLPPTPCR